ncbi:MAG: TrmH family RNA methyltransferase [Rikenellaceae bacterium]
MAQKITNEELGRLTPDQFVEKEKYPIILVVDNVRSQNNIGSFFRTADSFCIEEIILCGISATPPSKEIHKTALGAELTVKWSYMKETIEAVEELNTRGYTTYAIEQVKESIMLNDFCVDSSKKYALIVGNEVNGVDQEVVDICSGAIEIPQEGTKHSLNVSVAAGVVLWHFFKQSK